MHTYWLLVNGGNMKKKVNISLDEEVVVILKKLAEEDHKPVSQWITDAVIAESKKRNKEKG